MARAQSAQKVEFNLIDLRKFGLGKSRQVDDTPYGGGAGLILRIEPLVAALEAAREAHDDAEVILLTPRGETFKQATAQALAETDKDLILIGGRYEGYDERIVHWVDRQISIGEYVLTGFELPALVVVDALVRLIPGVLGSSESCLEESFTDSAGTAEYPQYTKPADFRQLKVPEILLSGNHQAIEAWRSAQRQEESDGSRPPD